jgi:hypothetical protein
VSPIGKPTAAAWIVLFSSARLSTAFFSASPFITSPEERSDGKASTQTEEGQSRPSSGKCKSTQSKTKKDQDLNCLRL